LAGKELKAKTKTQFIKNRESFKVSLYTYFIQYIIHSTHSYLNIKKQAQSTPQNSRSFNKEIKI